MVLSVKAAAGAGYYFQPWGVAATPQSSRGVWLRAPKGLGLRPEDNAVARTGRIGFEVSAVHLHRLLHRMTVDGGESPIFSRKQSSSGYDFVFSAPKSLSVLWALSSRAWRTAIETAHERAVEKAVDLLAERAIAERVGKGGQKLRPASAAMAAFFHYRCRPAHHKEMDDDDPIFADPNLHTHVVVPDIVVSDAAPAERRLKIAYTALYRRWSMALGAWYHAHLAHTLQRLGLAIEPAPGGNGLFQIKGIAPELITAFSARTQGVNRLHRYSEVGDALDVDKANREPLTRQEKLAYEKNLERTKTPALASSLEADESRWRALGAKLGITKPLVDTQPCRNAYYDRNLPPISIILDHADAIIDDLTREQAVLQRPDFFRAIAARLVVEGAPRWPTQQMVDLFLRHEDLVRLAPTDSYRLPQWTSKATLRDEKEVVSLATRLSAHSFPSVTPQRLVAGSLDWSDDQWRAIAKLASADRLVVMTGAPGSGKTSLLKPVADAYRRQHPDIKIIAAAEAWKTALALKPYCGEETYALAALFEKERHGRLKIGKDALLVVDEVSLLSTKRMLQLLRMVDRTGAKLILIGDGDQLRPIGAGSGLDLIRKALQPIVLTEIKRQSNANQRQLVETLVAIASMERNRPQAEAAQAMGSLAGLLTETGAWVSRPSSRDAIQDVAERVAAWDDPANVNDRLGRSVALTRSHREAHSINRSVRSLLRERQQLTGDDLRLKAVTPTGLTYPLRIAVGDHVRFLTRLRKHKVYNGSRGLVIGIDGRSSIKVRLLDPNAGAAERVETIAISDLMDDEGRVRLACDYAATVFSSQGATYDDVIVLRPKSMRFRELYVALTRARTSAQIVDVHFERANANLRRQQGVAKAREQQKIKRSITLDLLESKRRDRPRTLAIDADRGNGRNSEPRRTPWLWDALGLE